MEETEFIGFPKIARLSRDCIITEKIDGTNGQILITDGGCVMVGSRGRWILPTDDNHGFCKWVVANINEILTLGPGRHFGEWWGSGINRGYGLTRGKKHFSLFNTIRWCLHDQEPQLIAPQRYQEKLPPCCGLVPVLYKGLFDTDVCDKVLESLKETGSKASPGYMNPEGIVIHHIAGNVSFKKTIDGDGVPKSKQVKER